MRTLPLLPGEVAELPRRLGRGLRRAARLALHLVGFGVAGGLVFGALHIAHRLEALLP